MSIVGSFWNFFTCGSRRLDGPFRVAIFCLLAVVLPCVLLMVPLYLRYEYFKDTVYYLQELDLVTVDRPVSTIWCSEHELRMNATFNAYLLNQPPEEAKTVQKYFHLADDMLEYLSFFLLQGSKVTLSVCSIYDGAKLMVVQGTKNWKHCALVPQSPQQIDQVDLWNEVLPHGEPQNSSEEGPILPIVIETDKVFGEIRSGPSSVIKNLWNCYGKDVVLTQTILSSPRCLPSQEAIDVCMSRVHELPSTGYYYYIFYSENDIPSNDIFAQFDVENVEYFFHNYTNSCRNSTSCSLPLSFWSRENVLLEVPIQDENRKVTDEDTVKSKVTLISTCKPRLGMYLFFPVAILAVFILCAFI